MKKTAILLCLALVLALLPGCASEPPAQIAATTLPVYEFTRELCAGTPLTVTRLVTEQVSCLHDYSLNVRQVKAAEAAEVLVISGGGLEDFMEDLFTGRPLIDASEGIGLLCGEEHEEEHAHDHGHSHEQDPHIWLSPVLAQQMARNICVGLTARYPDYGPIFEKNLASLLEKLEELQQYGEETLSALSCREMITFHDGFAYFADAFGLTILEAVEEESGSEASAGDLIHLIELTREHHLPAIFTERNSSASAASVISRETGAQIYELDMAMAGDSYFDAMYRNMDSIKEALG